MEGWRQRRPGSNAKTLGGKRKTDLTLTGLLMEGLDLTPLAGFDPGQKVHETYDTEGIPKSFVYGREGKLGAQSFKCRFRSWT
jgi:hypothetical protein